MWDLIRCKPKFNFYAMFDGYDGNEETFDPDNVPIYAKPSTPEEEAATARYRKKLAERLNTAGKPASNDKK